MSQAFRSVVLDDGDADLAFTPILQADLRHQTEPWARYHDHRCGPRYMSADETSPSLAAIISWSGNSATIRQYGKTWRVTNFATKKELALAGLGWGGIPHHMIVEELAEGRLVEFHVDGIPVRDDFEIAMVRRMDRPIGPVAEHLWSLKLSQEIGQVGKVYSSG